MRVSSPQGRPVDKLPQFLLEMMENCPIAGSGVNGWLFAVSRHLHAHLDQQSIFQLLRDKTRHCGRPVTDAEIVRQIKCSLSAAWTPNSPEAFAHADQLDHGIVIQPRSPSWPEADLEAIRAIVSSGWDCTICGSRVRSV